MKTEKKWQGIRTPQSVEAVSALGIRRRNGLEAASGLRFLRAPAETAQRVTAPVIQEPAGLPTTASAASATPS